MFGLGHVTYQLLLKANRKEEEAEDENLLKTNSTHVDVQTAQDLAIRLIIPRGQ